MRQRTNPLDGVRVAAPCSAGWENMVGTERVRFCGQCSMNVYNLSEMTKSEAERLVAEAEGRLCVRYYRRSDGTILTRNCPEGLRALRRRLSRVAAATVTAILSFLTGVLAAAGLKESSKVMNTAPAPLIKVRWPEIRYEPPAYPVMGEMMVKDEVVGRLAPRVQQEEWVEGKLERIDRQPGPSQKSHY